MVELRAALIARFRLTLSTAFAGGLLTLCVAASTASALPPIRECGDFVPTAQLMARGPATGAFTRHLASRPSPTSRPVWCGVRTRVNCPLYMARHWRKRRYQGLTCHVHVYYELTDECCTNGSQVIHSQGGD